MPYALPLYAVTLFVSAFILFLVQPIVGKIILPKLGGTPQVWNTCMVFFQMVLLAGYAYTHNVSTRLNLRQQLIVHAVLLALPLIVLLPFPFALGGEYVEAHSGTITGASNTAPIEITAPGHGLQTGMRAKIGGIEGNVAANDTWIVAAINSDKFSLDGSKGNGAYKLGGTFTGGTPNPRSLWGFVPDLGSNPIPSTLAILFLYVALPFLVVATTAPLLQKWFAHTGHPASKDPYFLYGASNLGSMLSLIVYPALIEPWTSLAEQGWIYTIGYISLTAFVLTCAALVWNSKDPSLKLKELAPEPAPAPAAPTPPVSPAQAQTAVTATAPLPTPAPAAPSSSVKPGQPPKHGKSHAPKPHGAAEAPVPAGADELTGGRRLRWVMLAAIPSSLMLGITTHITTDLSPIPLFWLIPLILYLGSFILVFARWPVVWTEQPHQYFVYAQPFFIWLMIMTDVWNLTQNTGYLVFAIFAHVAGFFTTTMMCHGELAKDRPGTKHLTEFYLWMSVGGMVGGMFNALIAPVVFKYGLWEFPLAIFAAVIVRPKMFDIGLLDNWIAGFFEGHAEAAPAHKPGHKGKPAVAPVARAVTANESLVQTLDFAWPITILVLTAIMAFAVSGMISGMADSMFPPKERQRSETSVILSTIIIFGIPLGLAVMSFARPLRVGLGVGAVLLLFQINHYQSDTGCIHRDRSYFGAISVKETVRGYKVGDKTAEFRHRQLIHGHINHGMNFTVPDFADRGNSEKDKSRLATTYYHREGPVGRVMEKFNWNTNLEGSVLGIPGKPNTFNADARLPASVFGSILADSMSSSLPIGALAAAWSEPPICTVGLGTGTMASYGRPYQHVHFYEIDNQILRLSLLAPTSEITGGEWKNKFQTGEKLFPQNVLYKKLKDSPTHEVYFNYLEQAIERGCSVQVLMGDARLRMALPYKNHYKPLEPGEMLGGGPDNFYHMMVVDAFSSDAIPAHLLTKQAFEMYFRKLTEEGILCVHTSNRFVKLPLVVAAVSSELGYSHLTGHDSTDSDGAHESGHFTSEWVMVARKAEYLKHLKEDRAFLDKYKADMRKNHPNRDPEPYWGSTDIHRRYLWTDDYYNLLSVVRFLRSRSDD